MPSYLEKLIYAGVAIAIALLINVVAKLIYKRWLSKNNNTRKQTIFLLFLNIIRYSVSIIIVFIILGILQIDTTALLAGAGFLGLVAGVALQSLIQDMISGVFIIFEDQYEVGEYVKLNGVVGSVLEIGLKTTKLKTYEGELHILSNGSVKDVINYSRYPSLCLVDMPIPNSLDVYEILNITRTIIKDFKHNNIVSKMEVLGIQDVYPTFSTIRIAGYSKSYEHFDVNRSVKAYILDGLKCQNIAIDSIPYIKVQK